MKLPQWPKALIIIPLVTSCALFSPKEEDHTFHYLKGDVPPETTPSEFEKVLARSTSMAGGNYQISAFPYTEGLVKALAKDHANTHGLTESDYDKLKSYLNEQLIEAKTCVHFQYEVLLHEKASKLNDWQLFLVDKNNQEYPLQWNEADLERPPVLTRVTRSGDYLEKWLGEGTACTDAKIDFISGTAVKAQPAYVQFPFDASTKIYWEYPEFKVIDGKEIKIEDRKRNYKSYRAW